ncbi:MAG TPA: polysaccharide pyruvyl transferase family protein [Candidatus Saccharimonadales bacterium]|nr:polysaccharide pyruvyl transferase family protein [Candidatus Saccharimonadales bacterium]
MAKSGQNILLLGSYGRGNIGDDAFLLAALKLFRRHNLFINSADDELLPKSVRGQVTTIATSGNRDVLRKIRVFGSIKHIVYCGGDVWVELYGDRFPRQSLYKMVVVNLLARLFGKKVHYLGCGIGKLDGYSLFLAKLSARLAHSILVREPRSARVLNLGKIRVLPDLVTNVDMPMHHQRKRGEPFTIGLSILYHLPDPQKTFPWFMQVLAKSLRPTLQADTRIVLFPMLVSPSDPHDDAWASEQLTKLLDHPNVRVHTSREVEDYAQAVADVDLLIGTRLHANIIALMAGVPILGISYRPKVAQFFEMNGLGQYCLELEGMSASLLSEKLEAIRKDYATALKQVRAARNRNLQERAGYQDFVTHLT